VTGPPALETLLAEQRHVLDRHVLRQTWKRIVDRGLLQPTCSIATVVGGPTLRAKLSRWSGGGGNDPGQWAEQGRVPAWHVRFEYCSAHYAVCLDADGVMACTESDIRALPFIYRHPTTKMILLGRDEPFRPWKSKGMEGFFANGWIVRAQQPDAVVGLAGCYVEVVAAVLAESRRESASS
jgi:hypothetical protein